MNVKLIHRTPDAEKHVAYCARVSSSDQDNPEYAKLLKYCIKHGHWSVFEMASMCIEIETSRAISHQIVRHKSFSVQEFSQRYSTVNQVELYGARRQDSKNRQNSIDDMSNEDKDWFFDAQVDLWETANLLYEEALDRGVAKEQARFLLPLNTGTRMYLHGNLRSWMHYILLREKNGTQLEHTEIALAIKEIFIKEFPIISEALEWTK